MFSLLVLHCDLCATQTEKLYLSSCPCVLSVSISVCASSQTKQVQWRNNAANPYPAFIIFVACFSKKLYTFFRSIFCIIIARYIINGRGHVAQLKLATQNEKSSNHRTWRFCTVMSNLHSEKVGKVPHHQIEPIMGGIVCVCVWPNNDYPTQIFIPWPGWTHTFIIYSPNWQAQCDCVQLMGQLFK